MWFSVFQHKEKSVFAILIKPNELNVQPYYIVPGKVIQRFEYPNKTNIAQVEPIPKIEQTEQLEGIVRRTFNGGQFKVNFWDN